MRAAAFMLAVLAFAPATAWSAVKGDGEKTTTRRDVGAFTAIRLEAPLDAKVRVGVPASVAVTIDSNLQELVRTRVEGRTLVVSLDRNVRWDGKGTVEVALPRLERLELQGSADADVEGGKGGDLAIALAGSGDVRWRGEAGALDVSLDGAGDVSLAGKADALVVAVAGAGDVAASGLAVRSAVVTVAGSGDVSVRLAGGTLAATIAGSGTVRWSGEGKVVRADVAGAGEVVRD